MVLDKAKKTLEIYKTVLQRKTKRVLYIATLVSMYLNLEAIGLEPEIIVGGIPIYNLQAIGHASSEEDLKYRAMGGIFLAHQKGGKKTFRFTAHITGAERFLWYKLLESLQILGTEELRPITSKTLTHASDLLYKNEDLTELAIPQELVKARADIYSFPFREDISDQEYAYHRTFPIITPSRIYTNMYLETLRVAEDVKLGKRTIEIDCAFRHFEAPTHFKTTNPEAKQTKEKVVITTEGKKEIQTVEIPPKKKFYTTYIPYKDAKAWRKIENMISLAWILRRLPFEANALRKKERGKFFVDLTNLVTTYTLHNVLENVKYKTEATVI